MNLPIPHLNLVLASLWIVLGFASGCLLGLKFHETNWLEGYASHKRRFYRLAHLSFFGLAFANLLFYLTVRNSLAMRWPLVVAAWGLIVGAASMPLSCIITAHDIRWRMLFAIPVSSLLAGGLLTLWEVIKL